MTQQTFTPAPAINEMDYTVPRVAQMAGIPVKRLDSMIERGEVPTPYRFSEKGTRYYRHDTAVEIRKIVDAMREVKA